MRDCDRLGFKDFKLEQGDDAEFGVGMNAKLRARRLSRAFVKTM